MRALIVTTSHGVLNAPGETTGKATGSALSELTHPYYSYLDAGMQIDLTNGSITAKNFLITSAGAAKFRGEVTATGGVFGGWTIDGTQLKSNSNAIAVTDTNMYLETTVVHAWKPSISLNLS